MSNVPAPSTSSGRSRQATQEIEEQYANEGSLFMRHVIFFNYFFSYYAIYIHLRLTSTMLFLYVGI